MCITVQQLSYQLPSGQTLFHNLTFTIAAGKTGLTGDNGTGKSTLLQLISRNLQPTIGTITIEGNIAALPQDFSLFSAHSVAQVLGVDKQLEALHHILSGLGTEQDYFILDDAWDLEERIENLLQQANLSHISLQKAFYSLSGGEMSRLLFASLLWKEPDFILLDEPTNHLDTPSREAFYQMISTYKRGMLVVSHDRQLLRIMDKTLELSTQGLKLYGGNYDFYQAQKEIEQAAAAQQYANARADLKKSICQQRQMLEKQEKRSARGEKQNIQKGMDKMALNYMRDASEKTMSFTKSVQASRMKELETKVTAAKERLPQTHTITIDLETHQIPAGKKLIIASQLNYEFPEQQQTLWAEALDFELSGGQRLCLSGNNGSGKSTLLHLITGQLQPTQGNIYVGTQRIGILDQKLALLDNELTLLENVRRFAPDGLPEHELRIRLGRFLFYHETVFKKADVLSGGEKMRAALACLLVTGASPDLLILDEPTNNLDISSIHELVSALTQFHGSIIVVSHDQDFLKDIGITHELRLDRHEPYQWKIW
ncbi:ABC-F family ATP-binding cassette domain-containing protein [Rhodocytophaga rosea]|uniref:ABC-F family ATP-binding cassette domain-containing protein n=1 Tax=Rhodocytophaga rosea TaxID=2704465 RepID=A0A6C0GPZ2_9BACT|nr:ABC-F family ATP-binding cassette domain-containing protein [Rhodocytophaga rosea]QHT70111.1 ABC-F family ATP-binding cassette domain-containing protein [Rhodocytophaga rosea]